MTTSRVATAKPRSRWRAASVLAGTPAALICAATLVLLVAGFPITLLVAPLAIPVLLLSATQTKAAYRCWSGSPDGPRRLRAMSWVVLVVVASLLAVGLVRGRDDTTIRDPDSVRAAAALTAGALLLLGTNSLALVLLRGIPSGARLSAATVAKAAAAVLAAGVLTLLFIPVKG